MNAKQDSRRRTPATPASSTASKPTPLVRRRWLLVLAVAAESLWLAALLLLSLR
jgi:hypothetical protein